MPNPTVSGLSTSIVFQRDLIKKAVAQSDTIKQIAVQTGVKKNADINVVTASPTITAAACGWNDAGSVALSARQIQGAKLKVNLSFCPDQVRGKYGEWELKSNANEHVLPFDDVMCEILVENIQKGIETLIWKGNTGGSPADPINGVLTIAGADANVLTTSVSSTETDYEFLMKVNNTIPEAVYGKAVIFVPPYLFRGLMQNLVVANLYHYNPGDDLTDVILPGTQTRVHLAQGMAGAKKAFACDPDLLVYGTDMESDAEKFKLWWSDDAQEFRFAANWVSGINYAFSDLCVLGTDSRS